MRNERATLHPDPQPTRRNVAQLEHAFRAGPAKANGAAPRGRELATQAVVVASMFAAYMAARGIEVRQ